MDPISPGSQPFLRPWLRRTRRAMGLFRHGALSTEGPEMVDVDLSPIQVVFQKGRPFMIFPFTSTKCPALVLLCVTCLVLFGRCGGRPLASLGPDLHFVADAGALGVLGDGSGVPAEAFKRDASHTWALGG